jgi:hypothetical protein
MKGDTMRVHKGLVVGCLVMLWGAWGVLLLRSMQQPQFLPVYSCT